MSLVVGIAAGVTIIACGGGNGGGNKNPDAKVFNDAKVFMDAPGSSGGAGIGKDCKGSGNGDPTLCPTTDPLCVSLNGTKFFCTKSCGTAGSGAPPNGGNAVCMMMESSTGTPQCVLVGQGSGSSYPWACGVTCGTYMGSNLGTCPSNLTCTSNICQ